MATTTARKLDGTETALEAPALDDLRRRVEGGVIVPGDPDYDRARRVWNGMIDRRPALVVRCRGAGEVAAAVRFARAHDLLLAVRGGGHNVAGFGTCDGGLVIDLSPMRRVRVDPEARRVRVGAGASWGDVDRETQAFALAAPGGIVSTTGVAGLTLGGGQGWLRRTHGMTCDNLLSADLVTADGGRVRASEDENADLFWALRGGGGNFGVVTSFEYRLHPIGPTIAFAGPVFPLESTVAVIAGLRDLVRDAPDPLNASATWWTIPAAPGFPPELHGRPTLVVGATWAGPPEEGEARLRPIRVLGQPLLDLSATLPYTALQQLFDPFFPAGELHYYWKSIYLERLDDELAALLADRTAARPSPLSMIALWALGGALARVEPGATAAGARNAPFVLEILANWPPGTDAAANIAWAQDLFSAARPFSTGKTNLNFPGLGDDTDFVRAAFGANWDRLAEIKRRYDPENVFRLNQNVPPGAA